MSQHWREEKRSSLQTLTGKQGWHLQVTLGGDDPHTSTVLRTLKLKTSTELAHPKLLADFFPAFPCLGLRQKCPNAGTRFPILFQV